MRFHYQINRFIGNPKSCFWLFLIFTVSVHPNLSYAQVFTFDYLSYFDEGVISKRPQSFSIAPYLFHGNGEFDGAGNSTGNNISYVETHVHLAYGLVFKERFQFTMAFQFGGLTTDGAAAISYGDLWILGKYGFSKIAPIAFRVGFKLGKVGKPLWMEQNDWDFGILSSTSISRTKMDAALSYRIRARSSFDVSDFISELPGRFDQPGNALHYKFQIGQQTKKGITPSVFILGYFSDDKKLGNQLLPDSKSSKVTAGVSLKYQKSEGRSYSVGLLIDVAGTRDKKGLALAFTLSI
jgi:hypothetical protein